MAVDVAANTTAPVLPFTEDTALVDPGIGKNITQHAALVGQCESVAPVE